MPESWKIVVTCSRAQAQAAAQADLDPFVWANEPVLVATERDEKTDAWELHAHFAARPDDRDRERLADLAPRGRMGPTERLGDEDWVTLSQQGLEPVRAGRFHIRTPGQSAADTPGVIDFEIPASMAFGTGHHQTTSGCLHMLDRMRRSGVRAGNVIDVGTGTGLLAMAAGRLWPRAYLTASDLDPLCAQVVRQNAARHDFVLGRQPGEIAFAVADGLHHPALVRRAPYDLVIANILAGPLIALSAEIGAALEQGGHLLLAGLLEEQAPAVIAAYRREGLRVMRRLRRDDWTILWLTKRLRHGYRRASRGRSIDVAARFGTGEWVRLARVGRYAGRALAWLLLVVGAYFGAALVGSSIPVNAGWVEPERGVTILVETNGIHTALVLPRVAAGHDWSARFPAAHLPGGNDGYTHVAISFGQHAFFLETETWADLPPGTAVKAIIGGDVLAHVYHYRRPAPGPDIRPLTIGAAQYRELVALIEAAVPNTSTPIAGYGAQDVFYPANGHYNAIRTCNVMTGEMLATIGVRTGWWTPMAGGVMKWVPQLDD